MRRVFTRSVCALLVAATIGEASAADTAPKPNILLILADDLGYSDLGCYGGEIETPALDGLASSGVRLTRLYNMGRCCPSRASILTGKYPHQVGLGHMVKDLGQPGYTGRLAADARTMAEWLKPAGYRCFLSGKWHLGTEDPTQHGFEEFYGTPISAKTFWDVDHFLRLPPGRERRAYDSRNFYGTDALTDYAIDFVKQAGQTPEQPWFLYLAYNAPHFPLHAPDENIAHYADRYQVGWDQIRAERYQRMKDLQIISQTMPLTPRSPYWDWGASEVAMNPAWDSLPEDRRADLARRMAIYAAMIERMDQNVERLVTLLRESDQLENTFIVFLSDNGACAEWDPFGFDGASGPTNILHPGAELQQMGGPDTYHSVGSGWANASNTPWRLYKHYCHEGGVRSPGIIHWPAGLAGARIDHRPAHVVDLLPTVLELAKLLPDRDRSLPGISLLPLLRGESLEPRTIYFEHEGNRAVHDGRWKLVAVRNEPWELYDIERDPAELENLAASQPDLVRQLKQEWQAWAETNDVVPFPQDYEVGYFPDSAAGP